MIDDVIVIGGGISGLSCAYFMQKYAPKLSCRVLEATGRLGGSISTFPLQSGQLYESGPRSLRFRGESSLPACELIEDLFLTSHLLKSSAQANNRFVVLNGRPQALPSSILSLIGTSLGRHLLLKTILEPFQKAIFHEDESVTSFFARRAPSPIISKLVDALCSGIWGGDPNSLSIKGTFPELKNDEDSFGSVMRGRLAALRTKKTKLPFRGIYSLNGGLSLLIETLAKNLSAPVHMESLVHSLTVKDDEILVHTPHQTYRTKKVIMAAPEPVMQHLTPSLFDVPTPLASFATVVMGYKKALPFNQGYGILAPSTEASQVLGIVFDSSVFPEQSTAMQTRFSVILGGTRWPNVVNAREEDLYSLAKKAVCDWVGIDQNPDDYAIVRSNNSIPQAQVGHSPLMTYKASRCRRIFAIGASIGGVSVNQCIASAKGVVMAL